MAASYAIPMGYSPGHGFSFPKIAPPNVAEAAREAKELAKRYGPAFKFRLDNLARSGTRIAKRALPVLIAAEAGWLAAGLLQQYGPMTLDIRGNWEKFQDCGRSPQKMTYTSIWPSCDSPALPIGGVASQNFPPGYQPAIVKVAAFWEIYPLTYYINGDVLGKGAVAYRQFTTTSPPISVRNNISVAFPMADVPPTPKVLALYPMLAPVLAPRPREEPIPFPVLPHLTPNPSLPSLEQYLQSYTPDLVETFPANPPKGFDPVETFPAWIPAILNPQGGAVAEPGTGISFPAIPGAKPLAIPTTHRNEPPKKGEKERKFKLKPSAANLVLQVFNSFSEVNDLVDALYRSIERKYTGHIVHGRKIYDRELLKGRKVWFKGPNGEWRSRWVNSHTLPEKADWVYKNLDGIDLGLALENLVKNEIEDRVYGTLGRLHASATQARARAGGPDARSATLSRASGIDHGSGRLPVDDAFNSMRDYINEAFS